MRKQAFWYVYANQDDDFIKIENPGEVLMQNKIPTNIVCWYVNTNIDVNFMKI